LRDTSKSLIVGEFDLGQVIPKELEAFCNDVPEENFAMSETELIRKGNLSYVESRVRMSFWKEYESSRAQRRVMDIQMIAAGAAVHVPMIRAIFARPLAAAFVLTPPTQYVMFLDEALNRGLMRLREVLDFPLRNPVTGMPDLQAAELLLKVTGFLDLRKHGGIVQKQLNVNVGDGGAPVTHQLGGSLGTKDIAEIDKKIRELERTMDPGKLKAFSQPQLEEATVVEVERKSRK
jgi:hypothetical protein